jgi:RHS repeat-associated protein
LRTYLWGLDLSGSEQGAGGVGGLLKITDYTSGTTHHFVAYDGNGNVAGLVNSTNASVSARYEYGPFGEAIRATGPMAANNPIRFSSKYTDQESGLLYYGYRFYNPSTGRWVNRDPMGERGGKNLCGFVGNRPTYRYDRLGLAETGPVDRSPVPTETPRIGQGFGPVTIRWYFLDGACCTKGCNAVMTEFANNLNTFSGSSLPVVDTPFSVIGGGPVEAGKTLQIDGPGPVNPYVTVTKASGNCVRFRTLKGHPEIGDIEFCCRDTGKSSISFGIVSTTQPATVDDYFLYTLPVPFTGPLIEPATIHEADPAGTGFRGVGYTTQTAIWNNLLNNVASFASCGSKKKAFGDRWIFQDIERFARGYYTANP